MSYRRSHSGTKKSKIGSDVHSHVDDDEMSEQGHDHEGDDDGDASSVQSTGSQRGRPRVIESWTRVISLERDDLDAPHKHPLNTDLLLNQNLPRTIFDRPDEGWEPFFLTKEFTRVNIGITTENFALDDEALLQCGREASQLRKSFRERAEAAA